MSKAMPTIADDITRGIMSLMCAATIISLLLAGPVFSDDTSNDQQTNIVTHNKATQEVEITQDKKSPQQQEKDRMKLGLVILFFGIAGLFIMLLLITVIRISRLRKKRLGIGKREKRTEYIDAWSQYRLKDDPTESQDDESQE